MPISSRNNENQTIAQGWVDENCRPWVKIRLKGGVLTDAEKPALVDTGFNLEISVDYDTFQLLKEKNARVYVRRLTLANGKKQDADVLNAEVRVNGTWHPVQVICMDKSNNASCMIGTKFLDKHNLVLKVDMKNKEVEISIDKEARHSSD